MKRRVPGLIKRIIAAMSSKSNELRTRIMIFFLLHRNQSLLLDKFQAVVAGRHSHRKAAAAAQSLSAGKVKNDYNDEEGIHVDYCPRGRGGEEESFIMYMDTEPAMTTETSTVVDPTAKQVFSYAPQPQESTPAHSCIDLTHTLFKESEEEMKKLKDNEDAASINTMVQVLEDMDNDGRLNEEEEDIDHAADVFIERFRRQMLLQKQLSLQERHSSTTAQILQHNV